MENIKFSEGISETLDILKHLDKEYVDKIPENLKKFLEKNKSVTYIPKLDHSKRINELNLKETTKDILTTLYIKYWATMEEKSMYTKILKENEIKYQKKLSNKYNSDNLFKVKEINKEDDIVENLSIVEYKESLLTKFMNKVKKLFNKI